jgi:molybdate transport system substrate-binding protein
VTFCKTAATALAAAMMFAATSAHAQLNPFGATGPTFKKSEPVEIHVLSSTGVKSVVEELAPQFEKKTGYKLMLTFNAANILKEQIDGGAPFDVAILTPALIDAEAQQGKVVAGTKATIARAGIGLAVRAGAPKPSIGTVDGLKKTLLDAKTVAYTTQGQSGAYFMQLVERLGIADAVKAKGKTLPGGAVAEFVAKGEAEVAVQLLPELKAVPGVDVTPFPAEAQSYIVLSGAVGTATKQPKPAGQLLEFLTSPAAVAVKQSKGMEPG